MLSNSKEDSVAGNDEEEDEDEDEKENDMISTV